MTLTQLLLHCENDLGWVPTGRDRFKSRAVMHSIITKALDRQQYTLHDFALAVAYCKRKRLPISTPLQLLPLIPEARALAAPAPSTHSLDQAQAAAVIWEQQRSDEKSTYWIGRILRSVADGLAEVLIEWQQAGRGT